MKRILLLLVLSFFWSFSASSQGFKVKEFKQNINDGSAFQAPMDAYGHPCGLIKVRTVNEELKFKGEIIGEVNNKTNEYWVYMPKGSKQLIILHPNFLPVVVDFGAFGIEGVSSKATYILTLSEQKYNKEKAGLIATVKPEKAALYIDDVFVENLSGNGLYQLYLPKGNHICRIEQKGYRPNVQAITTGKGTQKLNVELESMMAELEVKCKTSTAEIYIDGELKGNGVWKGFVIAGEHQIEARQHNYETSSRSISVAEKEKRSFVMAELKRSIGKLYIETIPNNSPVSVDGEYVGMSPCTIDVETGSHYVSCKNYGCAQFRTTADVESGKQTVVKAVMNIDDNESEYLREVYVKAYAGDMEAIEKLINVCIEGFWRGLASNNDPQEAIFWLEKHPHPEFFLDFEAWISAYCHVGNPEKALQIYYPIKNKVENRGGMFLSESIMSDIGDAFLKKKEIDKAIQCYEKAGKHGYEGLGDCYRAKGNKQLAASYYSKCQEWFNKNSAEKKLKELENR